MDRASVMGRFQCQSQGLHAETCLTSRATSPSVGFLGLTSPGSSPSRGSYITGYCLPLGIDLADVLNSEAGQRFTCSNVGAGRGGGVFGIHVDTRSLVSISRRTFFSGADVLIASLLPLLFPLSRPSSFSQIPGRLLADRTHREMIPHEEPGSPTEIKCDFPFIRLKAEPARE